MTGIAIHTHQSEIDSVNELWECALYPPKTYSLQKMKFVIFCVDNKPVLAGRISAITCYPNDLGRPLRFEFSQLLDDPVIPSVEVGTERDEILLLRTETGSNDVPPPSFSGSRSKSRSPLSRNAQASLEDNEGNPFVD